MRLMVPIETIKLTPVPRATGVPPAGSWLMIFPAATVVLGAVVTVPMFKPTPLIALWAAAWVCPTTLGTVAVCGPEEMNQTHCRACRNTCSRGYPLADHLSHRHGITCRSNNRAGGKSCARQYRLRRCLRLSHHARHGHGADDFE